MYFSSSRSIRSFHNWKEPKGSGTREKQSAFSLFTSRKRHSSVKKALPLKLSFWFWGGAGLLQLATRQNERLTSSQTVLPLAPKTEWDLSVILMVTVFLWYYHCTRLSPSKVIPRQRRKVTCKRAKSKLVWDFAASASNLFNGTVEKSNARPTVFRPLCEDRSNVGRQLYFFKIAARSAFRSTLKTSDSLERRASTRLKARSMRREQRALVKIFPVCRVLWYFLSHRKYM